MSEYTYSHLPPASIRLLRLLPSEHDPKHPRCELFEYFLQHPNISSHPYEALSYVWGSEDKPKSITVNNQNLHITQNLYIALLRLQDSLCSRVIWIDAICIDQANEKEKEHQIPLMAEIYAKARHVVVRLGEAEDDSDQALEEIRLTGERATKSPSHAKFFQRATLKLLQRSWFRRVWILQEVAAARHILVMSGSTEIDGHAFGLGIGYLDMVSTVALTQVIFLLRGAVFRSRNVRRIQEELSLGKRPLGELLDNFHTYEATKLHDKVYALLGMCSDDLSTASLAPNYALQWSILMERLVKFILSDHVFVSTWENKEIAVIKAKGCILGKVSKVEINNGQGGQTLEVIFKHTSKQLKHIENSTAHWNLSTSAKLIQNGDLICLLEGASRPTIVRLRKDYFSIVSIATKPPKHLRKIYSVINWSDVVQSAPFHRNFQLVWDWESSLGQSQDAEEYNVYMRVRNLPLDVGTGLEGQLSSATRVWYIALILGDLGEYEADERLRMAVKGYANVIGREQHYVLQSQYGLTPLSWAAGNGYDAIVSLLLAKDDVDIDLKDSQHNRTPLSWAAEKGHKTVVKMLLDTCKVDVNSKDTHDRTPLSWAADNGHEAVVKLLLETSKVDVDLKDTSGRAPSLWAFENGYESLVQDLLDTGKIDADLGKTYCRTPLWWAAKNGHEAVVKLLLKTCKVEADLNDGSGRTPLFLAAESGHEAVVKLLLETGKVDVNLNNTDGRTPLWWAAKNGHETVVKLLLETGKVDNYLEDQYIKTPLFWATENGHSVIVKLLRCWQENYCGVEGRAVRMD